MVALSRHLSEAVLHVLVSILTLEIRKMDGEDLFCAIVVPLVVFTDHLGVLGLSVDLLA